MEMMQLIVLLLLTSGCYALRCGGPLTTACLGETDIRYDPEASNNIVDQAEVWGRHEGYFRGEGQLRVNINDIFNAPVPATETEGVISVPFIDFTNKTFDGSRYYVYSLIIVSAQVTPRFAFGTTTHEKDGSLIFLRVLSNTTLAAAPSFANPSGGSDTLRSYPVDRNAEYISGNIVGAANGLSTLLRVCLDQKCNFLHESNDVFTTDSNGTVARTYSSEMTVQRIATGEEWVQDILGTYNSTNLPADQRIDPRDPCSVPGVCPTEEEWCTVDPNCSVSPYQEPSAHVRGGVVAGFVVAGIVLLVLVLYVIHRVLVAQQAKRYRTLFAKRIADTIDVRGSLRSMSPEALAEEFKRIDKDVQDGKLSKDELWDFVSSGKAGEMDQKDFDALFAAIDLDKSGAVDFLEFCAFMGKCHDEYRAARVDRGSIVARSARRLSAADTTARRLSTGLTSAKVPKREKEEEEEEE